MQLGADIQDNKKKPQVFWVISVACHSLRENTINPLQISKPKPVAEGNHNLMPQEEAWKDFYCSSSSFKI